MPIQDQDLAALNSAFDALPDQIKAIFNNNSTQDVAEAISSLVASRRTLGMVQLVNGTISSQVTNWPAIDIAFTVADSATLYDSLRAFKAAKEARNSTQFVNNAVTAALAALNNFGM